MAAADSGRRRSHLASRRGSRLPWTSCCCVEGSRGRKHVVAVKGTEPQAVRAVTSRREASTAILMTAHDAAGDERIVHLANSL